ncbi:MAG: ribonuclease HI [Arcobacter sp.]|nr:MAG: ribonuclease HI [Arcobacter sp.]
MKIDENYLDLIINDSTLNKAQAEILNLAFPLEDSWQTLILGKELSTRDANLLILLRGKLVLKTQEQIIKNYETLSSFRNPKKAKPVNQNIQSSGGLSIYCDGACSGNPGEAGSGLAVYSSNAKPVLYYGAYVKNGTNNIAELNALYKALLLCESNPDFPNTILSDSKYSIDCICTWAYGWKAKGWTKKGGEIKNLELIKEAHLLYEKIKNNLTIKHVKGHAGVEGNELADRMAVHTIKAKNESYEIYSYDSIDSVLNLKSY